MLTFSSVVKFTLWFEFEHSDRSYLVSLHYAQESALPSSNFNLEVCDDSPLNEYSLPVSGFNKI